MSADSAVALEVRGIRKRIGGREILKGIDLEVRRGEIFGLLGPNGAGKTTLIRVLLGLIRPEEGSVRYFGVPLAEARADVLRRVGAIIEKPDAYPYLSGYENLLHFGRMHPQGVTKERILEVARTVGLSERIHDRVSRYSLGMKQRLALAIALLHDPEVLILDEPMNGLDPEGMRDVRDLLLRYVRERGGTVLLSSHLLREMELIADRFAMIAAGSVLPVEELRGTISREDREEWMTYLLYVAPAKRARTELPEIFSALGSFPSGGRDPVGDQTKGEGKICPPFRRTGKWNFSHSRQCGTSYPVGPVWSKGERGSA
ncbi:ABC transporter ATP-binding protein [Brockia lithotrophica]|uniref:ABC-2 type transport system ATP-binding protein n=1 Tax=Brockia lithotrophica TaxID=933949 RepID=A0A660L6V4_9BACL|nr:ABC transporter ATP-binding protein [Brockia lithotrophica]RKQ88954.1 ABC-2 type transport system ATP-binding protein [Brockia lithotrophica]